MIVSLQRWILVKPRTDKEPHKLEERKGAESSAWTSEGANPADTLIFLSPEVACMLKTKTKPKNMVIRQIPCFPEKKT